MFIHYGLYSAIGRGEWLMNREKISPTEYVGLAKKFTAKNFDADFICSLAAKSGVKYIVFTTMHHDGFRLYDSNLSDFTSTKTAAKRDLTSEILAAAKKHNLKIGLYHSLNNWSDQPDAVTALESKKDYDVFIKNTHARLEELLTKFNPIDIMWYDGWWPFNAEGWQAEKMNRMIRKIQPHIIFNGRNGLPGDFSTPEGHISAPKPYRPWEACMTLNDHWGYYRGDDNWKSAGGIIDMLAKVACGKGNLLLNIGPKGDGSIPEASVKILEDLGAWMKINSESIFGTDIFTFDLMEKGKHRADWIAQGHLTAKGNNLYIITRYWPGKKFVISGLRMKVREINMLGKKESVKFMQDADKLELLDLPENPPSFCPVFRLKCDKAPELYYTGGMRIPKVKHPHYDPCPSDIAH
jgi:alpha-L-fucosidase